MKIDDIEVAFFREDGAPAEGPVYVGGEGPDGEVMFFELLGLVRPSIDGKPKYRRLLIRRVFPCLPDTDCHGAGGASQ